VLIALTTLPDLSDAADLVLWGLAALVLLGAALIGRALFYVLTIPTTMPGAFFWKNPAFEEHARDAGLANMSQVGVQGAPACSPASPPSGRKTPGISCAPASASASTPWSKPYRRKSSPVWSRSARR